MSWFNFYGLAIVAVVMIPNIVFVLTHKNDIAQIFPNKTVVVLELIGRLGCFAFMVVNLPYTYFNFWFSHALAVYLSVNGALCLAYGIVYAVFWKRRGIVKALSLSLLPSCIFLFSGIVLGNIPLLIFAALFCVTHSLIGYRNAWAEERTERGNNRKKYTVYGKFQDEAIFYFVMFLFVCAAIGTLFGTGSMG